MTRNRSIPRRLATLCVFVGVLVLAACGDDDDPKAPVDPESGAGHGGVGVRETFDEETRAFLARRPKASIVLAGAFFGRHKPCGCSAPQKGGLVRLAALIDRLNARVSGEVLPLALGWNLAGSGEEQEDAKAGLIRAALTDMAFGGLLLGDTDLKVPAAVQPFAGGGVNMPVPPLNVILPDSSSAHGSEPLLRTTLGERGVRVMSLVDPAEGEELKAIGYALEVLDVTAPFAQLTPDPEALWIVATRLPDQAAVDAVASAVARFGPAIVVDFGGAAGVTAFEARSLSADMAPIIVTIDEKGKAVGVLDFDVDPDGNPTIAFRTVDLLPELEEDDSPLALDVKALQLDYIDAVREEGYLPRFRSMPDFGPTFVGSAKCARCHQAIYNDWNDTPHAIAIPTLEERNYHWDPECVRCHVVGWYRDESTDHWTRFDSGFRSVDDTPLLGGVGCENCHGPGSRHVTSPTENPLFHPEGEDRLRLWRRRCLKCHDLDNSHGFHQDWEGYLNRVDHRAVPSDRRTDWPR